MITVEELIIQSLYHRLVLITVRRTGAASAAAGTGSSTDVSAVDGSVDGDGGAGRGAAIPAATECCDQTVVVMPAYATFDEEEGGDALEQHVSASHGLGYLYLGSLQPQIQDGCLQSVIHSELTDSAASTNALLRSLYPGGAAAGEPITLTRNVRTILDEGESCLVRAMMRTTSGTLENGALTQTSDVEQPMWCYGQGLSSPREIPAGNFSSVGAMAMRNPSNLTPTNPLIDLTSVDQFSLVRLEDTRDPSLGSLTMIHTNGGLGGRQQMAAGVISGSGDRHDGMTSIASQNALLGLTPELVGSRGALFVESGATGLVRREPYELPREPPGVENDSGIWDMMSALESGRPFQAPGGGGGVNGAGGAHVDLFRTSSGAAGNRGSFSEEDIGMGNGGVDRDRSGELHGSYRMFQLPDVTSSSPLSSLTRRQQTPLSHPARRTHSKGHDPTGLGGSGLSDVLQPATVVDFVVHRVEAPVKRLDSPEKSGGMSEHVEGVSGHVGSMSGRVKETPGPEHVEGMATHAEGMPGRVEGKPGNVEGMPGRVGGTARRVGSMPGHVGSSPERVGGTTKPGGGTRGHVGGMPGHVDSTSGHVEDMSGRAGGTPKHVGGTPGRVGGKHWHISGEPGRAVARSMSGSQPSPASTQRGTLVGLPSDPTAPQADNRTSLPGKPSSLTDSRNSALSSHTRVLPGYVPISPGGRQPGAAGYQTGNSEDFLTSDDRSKVYAQIDSLTSAEQSTIEELCTRMQTLRSPDGTSVPRPLAPASPLAGEGKCSNGENSKPGRFSPRASYHDVVEITSLRMADTNRRHAGSARHGGAEWPAGVPGAARRCKSLRSSPRQSLVDGAGGSKMAARSARASPTRPRFAIDGPSWSGSASPVPLRTSSPRVGGGPGGAYCLRRGGGDSEGESVTTLDSSQGRLHDGGEGGEGVETIEFERFAEWMRDLPEALHNVSLSELCIPGSHICVAIERDMRVDMDFSRCNYEMAAFLRRLPNLAVFNAFRAQMKGVWRAWMPKQALGVRAQLEAGARYLDVRVGKYLSAFYGEHGLYTRQLKKYLREVRVFVEEHPSEIVLLHFTLAEHLDRADKRRLVTLLFQVFGAKLACSSLDAASLSSTDPEPPLPSLSWMWSHSKQLIAYFPSGDMPDIRNHIFGGLVWSDGFVEGHAPKTHSIAELIAELEEADRRRHAELRSAGAPRGNKYKVANGSKFMGAPGSKSNGAPGNQFEIYSGVAPARRLHVTRAVLSPDMSMVFGRFDHRSMHELARCETATALCAWLGAQPRGGGGLNVVAVDFVGVGAVAGDVVRLNAPPPLETDV